MKQPEHRMRPFEEPWRRDTIKINRPASFKLHTEEAQLTEAAVEVALEAFGLVEEYDVTILATCRGPVVRTKVKAINEEDLEAKVRGLVQTVPSTFEIEGDEIAYCQNGLHEEYEFDLADEGEPWSWAAVTFVKEMAENPHKLSKQQWVQRAADLIDRLSKEPDNAEES